MAEKNNDKYAGIFKWRNVDKETNKEIRRIITDNIRDSDLFKNGGKGIIVSAKEVNILENKKSTKKRLK